MIALKTSSIVLGAHRPDLLREDTLAGLFRPSAEIYPEALALHCPVFDLLPMPAKGEMIPVSEGPEPDDNAYVLYTSGSTGKPKGIPITHRQICHLVRSEHSVLQVRHEDRVYQGFSVSFD